MNGVLLVRYEEEEEEEEEGGLRNCSRFSVPWLQD